MKIQFLFLLITLAALSCRREKLESPHSLPGNGMEYLDLNGREIAFNQYLWLDLNKDNRKDIGFGTMLVGDPIGKQDKAQYVVLTDIYSSLPVDAGENAPVQEKNEWIPVNDFENYRWYNAAFIVLAQKNIPLEGDEYWVGNWKNSRHKYLPVQVRAGDKRYNGWVELSFDMQAQKIILHRAAVSTSAEKEVKAGV